MDYKTQRRSRVALHVPMPPHNLREQMKSEGFSLPKVAKELTIREIKYPLGWYERPSRSDKAITIIFDEGGVERYRYRLEGVDAKPMFEAVTPRVQYNHQNGDGNQSGTGKSRNSIDIPHYGAHARVQPQLKQVNFTSFTVNRVSSTRD